MGNVTVTRPDSRVNLGAGHPAQTRHKCTVTIPLSPAHVRAIVGDGPIDPADEKRKVDQWITDFLSPAIEAMGRELDRRVAVGPSCRRCGGDLIGSEREHGTCGDCGDRWEASK